MTDADTFGQLMASAVGWSAVAGGAAGAVVGLCAAIGFSSGWEIIIALAITVIVVKWVMVDGMDVLGPVEIVGGVLTAVSA